MPRSIEAIIDRQLGLWEQERRQALRVREPDEPPFQPIITVSRQHGSHGSDLAARLAARRRYTLLHRNAIDRISKSTGHQKRLLAALDEHSRSWVTSWVDSLLSGRYLDETDYAVGLLRTISSMARLGGVVVVGRGANFIIGPAAGVHLRVVAPLDERVRHLMEVGGLSLEAATREIETVDREREKFIHKLFHRPVDDPLAYDMILNESGRSLDAMVRIATAVVREKLARLQASHDSASSASGGPGG